MSQIEENNKSKSTNYEKEESNLTMLNNNNESYQIMKNHRIKIERYKKKKPTLKREVSKNDENEEVDEKINFHVLRKRSNSVNLYKKHKKEKERKNKLKESCKNIRNNHDNIFQVSASNKSITRKFSKSTKNIREKKVTFKRYNLVEIIDVESYKKFNEENTYQDPYEDPEFLKQLNQLNENNEQNNIIEQNSNNENEKDDGKERVNCSCFIF